jgi:tetratricopeptide (TPR) repeat protein
MILCESPRSVLTLGLGGGVTLGTLTLYAAERIDSLEISTEVIDLAREYFAAANRGALTNPRVRHVIGDGRNHIEYTTRRYDVITSVPSNPWIAGIGSLFTVEFFQACRDRLEPGGIVCSWIHKINMREEDFATVVRTFLAVFGDSSQLWDLGYDCLLLGSAGPPIRLDRTRFASLLENPEIAKDLSVLGIASPETLCRHFLFDAEGMRRYARTAKPLNTDAFPILEFSAPYGLYGHYLEAFSSLAGAEVVEVPEEVLAGTGAPPGDLARRLQRAFHAAQRVEARQGMLASLQRDLAEGVAPARAALRTLVLDCVEDLAQIERSTREADPWLRSHANGVAARVLGVHQAETLAATVFSALVPLLEHSPPADRERLMAEAETFAPAGPATAALYAKLCLRMKLPGKAVPVLEEALRKFPDEPRLIQVLGIVEAESSRPERALELFGKALALAKEPALRSEIHANLAYLHQSARRWEEALRECENAHREDPKNTAASARRDEIRKAAAANP